jgi:hypothetical protein
LERNRQGLLTALEQVTSELAAQRAGCLVAAPSLQLAALSLRRRSLIAALVRIDERISVLSAQPPVVVIT